MRKGLIVPDPSKNSIGSGRTVYLTSRARRGLDDILNFKEPNTLRFFAYLLTECGYVTEDPFYLYANTPLQRSWKDRENDGDGGPRGRYSSITST